MNRKVVGGILLLVGILVPLVFGIVSKIQNTDDYVKINGVARANIKKVNDQTLPITNVSKSAPYIEGNQIYSENGEPLYLAGGCLSLLWDVANSQVGLDHTKEDLWQLMNGSGANFMLIAITSELWNNDPQQATYRSAIDQYVTWCNTYGLYYMFRIHAVGAATSGYWVFSGPGNNWKLADLTQTGQPGYYNRSIEMFKDLATLYGADNNNIGYGLLNEPYSGSDYTKWDIVISYYEDCIGNITAIDSDAIIWVMEPRNWGGQNDHWDDKGYLDYDQVVYEFHKYYHHALKPDGTGAWFQWAEYYRIGNFAAGYNSLKSYFQTYVMQPSYDGHPVFCGEYGIYATQEDMDNYGEHPSAWYVYGGSWAVIPDPYSKEANDGQQAVMEELGIHYSYFYMVDSKVGSSGWYALNPTGTGYSRRGEIWSDGLPSGLVKPS